MNELKMRLQKWLIELYEYRSKQPNNEKRIIVRYIEGKIETLRNVLELIDEIEKKGEDDDVEIH